MLLRLPLATALLWLGLSGCRHDVTRFASGAHDRAGEDAGQDAGVAQAELDAGSQGDGGAAFPYRWLVNNPGDGKEEGDLTIRLDCVRDGRLIPDCVFSCALDRPDFIACRDQLEAYMDPGDHNLCVKVQAPASDLEFTGGSSTMCVPWKTLPYGHPFLWQPVTPDAKSTELDVPLRCAQEPAPESGSVVRSDCVFSCSLDHVPYRDCTGSFEASGVKPGAHELRVITCGPQDHESVNVCRARVLRFDLDDDAAPAVVYEPVPQATLLEREQLGVLAALIDPYVSFAEACGSSQPASVHEQAIRSYLSYVQLRIADLKDASIESCRKALEARPAKCYDLPGVSPRFREDIMLFERLPGECRGYWGSRRDQATELPDVGPGGNGLRCITHAECDGACERADAWVDFQRTWGYCGDGLPAQDGIMCRTRGCEPEHLYCGKGACLPRNPAGTPCQRSREGLDCQDGLTCTITNPSVCAAPAAGIGETCTLPTDCKEGMCDLDQHQCVELAAGEP